MDITKAKKVVELEKEGKKVLVALWEGDKITSCVTDQVRQSCEACDGNEEVVQEYINHLKEQGYRATELVLPMVEAEESLPKFVQERGIKVKVTAVIEEAAEEKVTPAAEETTEEG